MKLVHHKIYQSRLFRNTARLFSANVLAQVIGLLIYPVLARMYTSEDFGLFNVFLSIGNLLVLFAVAEYHNAIVLPKRESEGVAMLQLTMFLLLGFALFCSLLLPFSSFIAALLKTPNLDKWLWLLPIYVLVMGGWNTLNYWYIRHSEFSRIQRFQISQSLLSAGGKVGLASVGCASGGLIVASVLAPFVSLVINLMRAGRKLFAGVRKVDWTLCKQVAYEYRKFPMFSLPRAVINSLSGNLPFFLLTPVFGLAELGYLGMAISLAFRPMNMISSSLYQTFYQHVTQSLHEGRPIRPFLAKFICYTLLASLPVGLLLCWILPSLTQWLLGEEWLQTGVLIRYLLPWVLMVPVGASISFVSDVFNKQQIAVGIELCYLILRVMALSLGIVFNSFSLAIMAYSLAGTLVIGGQIIWYLRLAAIHDESLTRVA